MVGGKVVYGAGDFAQLDETSPPPAMPDWSPVRTFGGYGAWGGGKGAVGTGAERSAARAAGSLHHCNVHARDHAVACASAPPIADLKSFWGALGCSCWAF
jgi:hypothetical protein